MSGAGHDVCDPAHKISSSFVADDWPSWLVTVAGPLDLLTRERDYVDRLITAGLRRTTEVPGGAEAS